MIDATVENLDIYIAAYVTCLIDWNPEVLSADETGSRLPLHRDVVNRLAKELSGKLDLEERMDLVRQGDKALREHAAEIWEWYKQDGRDREREEKKVPHERWWWYLDKPEVWPPLD